jgi:hypothetical protein
MSWEVESVATEEIVVVAGLEGIVGRKVGRRGVVYVRRR